MSSSFQKDVFEINPVKEEHEISDLVIGDLIDEKMKKVQGRPFRILDIGCGGGQLLEHLCSEPDIEVHGIDISEEAIKAAVKKGYRTYVCDLEKDRIPCEGTFDVVVMNDLIEHIINPDNVLSEARRLVREDGWIIVCTPNVSNPTSWIMQMFLDLPPMQSARYKSVHVRDYTLRTLLKAHQLNGLKVIECRGTFIHPFKKRGSRLLANKFPRISERIIVISQRDRLPKGEIKSIYFDTMELLRAE
jgi:methionine biosynthesis protein MetW